LGIPDEITPSKEAVPLTPFGEACSRRDLTSIYEILETVGYKDDEDVANEVKCNVSPYFFPL